MGAWTTQSVRVLAVLGILTFNFMFVLVALDATGHTGRAPVQVPAGSLLSVTWRRRASRRSDPTEASQRSPRG
jgi:hypothetical protein